MSPDAPDDNPLAVLGLDTRHERLYRLVVRHSGAGLGELSALGGLPQGQLRADLESLVAAGLVVLRARPDGGATVVARPPQDALGALVDAESARLDDRERRLAEVRDLLPALSEDHSAAVAPQGDAVTVEVLRGGDVAALVRRLSATSEGDLLWLRPDPWNVAPGHEIDEWVVELMRAGRRSRAIYQVEVLHRAPEVVRRRAQAGEHVRILGHVPTRLAVLGSSAAMVAARFGVFDDRRLVLRHTSLVAAMTLMFEGLWEKALPVPGLEGAIGADAVDKQLLVQLAGGAKDEQIARALDVSVRTVRRRVAALLDELDASSRFQAGAEAFRRGWL